MSECTRCGATFDHMTDEWVHASIYSHRADTEDGAFPLCADCGADAREFLMGEDRGGNADTIRGA